MGTLLESIAAVAAKAKRFSERGIGEQNTKASLIAPILDALGWDVRDPDEVHHEYRPTGKDSPVDYALKLMRKPRLFVEAKGLGETLADRRWIAQVLGYATVAGVEWCVLTDGDEWRFYNASATVDAEEKMFCRVKLTETAPPESAKALSLLSRENLEQNLLDVLWVSHFVDRRVKGALRDMLAGPTKAILKLVQQQVPKVTPKEIADSIRRLDIRIESPAVTFPDVGPAPRRVKPNGGKNGGPKNGQAVAVTLAQLIAAGLIKPNTRLFRRYKGRDIEATLLPDGSVRFDGQDYRTCSTAAEVARGTVTGKRMNTNGWAFWQFEDSSNKTVILDAPRQDFLRQLGGSARVAAPADR